MFSKCFTHVFFSFTLSLSLHSFSFFRTYAEEKNRLLAERCNRLSEAISKCDELSENASQLSELAKEQRESMQLLKIKCKEMVDNIEKSKCHFFSLHCSGGLSCAHTLCLNRYKCRNRSEYFY